jgi:hypothetical protein
VHRDHVTRPSEGAAGQSFDYVASIGFLTGRHFLRLGESQGVSVAVLILSPARARQPFECLVTLKRAKYTPIV